MTEIITSAQNPRVKQLLALQEKSRLRRESGLFVLEGKREIERCIAAGYTLDSLFVCPEICGRGAASIVSRLERVSEVSRGVYDKIAYRGGTEGIIAIVKSKNLTLEALSETEPFRDSGRKPVVVVLESVEKPGNIGAILRSADAAGADAVIVCDPLTDIYNPNLLRACTGTLFSMNVACCSSQEAISWLKSRGIRIFTAQLQDSKPYYDADFREASAIVIGTEATGLSVEWRLAADEHILIPMMGTADSLNASVSAAILLYESLRQRRG